MCGIVVIVSKKGYFEEGCVVGVDGSLYNVCLCLYSFFIYWIRLIKVLRNILILWIEFMRCLWIFLVKVVRRLLFIMLRMV